MIDCEHCGESAMRASIIDNKSYSNLLKAPRNKVPCCMTRQMRQSVFVLFFYQNSTRVETLWGKKRQFIVCNGIIDSLIVNGFNGNVPRFRSLAHKSILLQG